VKLRELLRKINDSFRPVHREERERLEDDQIDALSTVTGSEIANLGFGVGTAPTNWVPSPQDRPRH
jgi:hypothetical protein